VRQGQQCRRRLRHGAAFGDSRRAGEGLAGWRPRSVVGDAAANYRILEKCRLPIVLLEPLDEAVLAGELADCEWIVDALLGTGSVGSPRPPLDQIIAI